MRAASDCRPPPTARHASQTCSNTSHPPQQKDAVRNCAPARGRGPAPAQDRCAAPHGRLRATGPYSAPADPRPATSVPHDTSEKTLFPNAELNLLSPGSGCPLKARGMGGQDGLGADADAW